MADKIFSMLRIFLCYSFLKNILVYIWVFTNIVFHKYLWWLYALICCLVSYWLDLQVFPLCVLQIGDPKAAHRLLLAVATVAKAAPYSLPSRGRAADDSQTAENEQSSVLGLLPTALYHFTTSATSSWLLALSTAAPGFTVSSPTVLNLALWNWVFLQHIPQPLSLTEAR